MPRQKLELLAPSDRCRNKRTVAPGGRVGVSVGRTSAGSRGGLGSLGGEVWPVSSLQLRGWRRAGPGGDGLRRRAVPGRPGQVGPEKGRGFLRARGAAPPSPALREARRGARPGAPGAPVLPGGR